MNNKIKNLVVFGTTLSIVMTTGCGVNRSKSDSIPDSPVISISSDATDTISTSSSSDIDNSEFSDYSFERLLDITESDVEKNFMKSLYDGIVSIDNDFAGGYIDIFQDVRASITPSEGASIKFILNDYSSDELNHIFNGSNIDSNSLISSYKSGFNELVDAYIIESSKRPLDMSKFIDSDEGKSYYTKMNNLFMSASNNNPDAINVFASAVKEDFSSGSVESYKLSILPMVEAAKSMWKDSFKLDGVSFDFTSDNSTIQSRLSNISKLYSNDKSNPTYDQYMSAMSKSLKTSGFLVSDERRNLKMLDSYKTRMGIPIDDKSNTSSSSSSSIDSSPIIEPSPVIEPSNVDSTSSNDSNNCDSSTCTDSTTNNISEYEEEYPSSNEEAVDSYVEGLDNNQIYEYEEEYTYSK